MSAFSVSTIFVVIILSHLCSPLQIQLFDLPSFTSVISDYLMCYTMSLPTFNRSIKRLAYSKAISLEMFVFK